MQPGVPVDVLASVEPDEDGTTYGVTLRIPRNIGPEEIMKILKQVPQEEWSDKDWQAFADCNAQLLAETY